MSGRSSRTARSPTSSSTAKAPDLRSLLYAIRTPALRGGRFVWARCEPHIAASIGLSPSSGFPMTEIHDLSAVELLLRYRAKTLSPSEVFAAIEKHIARWEPHLKALYAYAPESARK